MKEGEKFRKVGSTNMNERSSRSHTIFRLRIESSNRVSDDETMTEGEQIMASQLNLVDLAGSEKACSEGAAQKGLRPKEGRNINVAAVSRSRAAQNAKSKTTKRKNKSRST